MYKNPLLLGKGRPFSEFPHLKLDENIIPSITYELSLHFIRFQAFSNLVELQPSVEAFFAQKTRFFGIFDCRENRIMCPIQFSRRLENWEA